MPILVSFYYPANSNNSPNSLPQNRIYGGSSFRSAYHHYTEVKKLAAPWMRAMIHLTPSEAIHGSGIDNWSGKQAIGNSTFANVEVKEFKEVREVKAICFIAKYTTKKGIGYNF